MRNAIYLVCVLGTLIQGCSCEKQETKIEQIIPKKPVEVDTDQLKGIQAQANVVRMEQKLFACRSTEEVKVLLAQHPLFARQYLLGAAAQLKNQPAPDQDPQFISGLYRLFQQPGLKDFYTYCTTYYGDFEGPRQEFEWMFRHVKMHFPDFKEPDIYTFFSGFNYPEMSLADSLWVVGLDYFLGPKTPFKPDQTLYPTYILRRFNKEHLVSIYTQILSKKYNQYDPNDHSLLAQMIYFGKAHYFTEQVMPNLHDSLNIGYTTKELAIVNEKVEATWAHFIEKKLLYNTSPGEISRYVDESPKVTTIGDDCPGRIGRWLGWMIVRKYMQENPEVSLKQLMETKDAKLIFKKSKFKALKSQS